MIAPLAMKSEFSVTPRALNARNAPVITEPSVIALAPRLNVIVTVDAADWLVVVRLGAALVAEHELIGGQGNGLGHGRGVESLGQGGRRRVGGDLRRAPEKHLTQLVHPGIGGGSRARAAAVR